MSRPSLKKLCVYAVLSVAGLVIMVCLQDKITFHQTSTAMVNNANIRKLAEQEHFHNVGNSADQSPKLLEEKPTTTTRTTNPSTTTLSTPGTELRATRREVKVSLNLSRPWYMEGGGQRPGNDSERHKMSLFPEDVPNSDRIPEQLMYLPPKGSIPENIEESNVPLKKILLWNGAASWGSLKPGRGVFLKEKCPVSSCALSSLRSEAETADLVIFKDHFTMPTFRRPKDQKWMLYLLECPLHTQMFKYPTVFNWTATYRRDSTVVAPYERWQYYNENVRTRLQEKNYARNKTKQVAWFVSNCGARNGRLNYARELGKYINVDIYGACGPHRCPRTSANRCFQLLDEEYKFYLAFENSNCKDYITEKFFVNGLGHDILPIAMGARLEDYELSAPHKSFLHVDQFSGPRQLAKFLHKLDRDESLYNEYFKWKGTGEFINTKFWCRVCSVLHSQKSQPSWFSDINEWWRGDGTCANSGWRPGTNIVEEEAEEQEQEHHPPGDRGQSWSYHEPKSSRDRAKILMGGS